MISDATRIRLIRSLLGMNSQDFAAKVGISASTLTSWEKDRYSPQKENRDQLAKLCEESGIAFSPSGMPFPAADVLVFKQEKES